MFIRAAGVFLMLLVAGCGSGKTVGLGMPAPGALSLDRDLQPLLTARCAFAGCHGGSSPQQGLDLSAGRAHSQIVNVDSSSAPGKKRVIPGNPANSFLYEKISRDDPSVGVRMPQTGQLLSQAEIDLIFRWIQTGANR